MSAAVITAKWTIEDYHRMIAAGILDDRHVELLNGEIVEMAPEGVPHASSSDRAERHIRSLVSNRAWLRVGKPITLPNNSEPEPDLCICRNIEYDVHHPYPEDIFWLIEFSDSSLKKDLEVKTQIYGAAGICEYWVINLKAKELIVFRSRSAAGTDSPTAAIYQSKQTFTSGSISPLAFQDVLVSVQQLFS